MSNMFCYEAANGRIKGDFNIYQARNGKIYIAMGKGFTPLTEQQINELGIDVYTIQEFDYDLFISAYSNVHLNSQFKEEFY